jgi:Sec-independent protein translocase protein TatA
MKKIKELDADLVKLPEKDIEKLIKEVISSVGSKIKHFKDEEEHKHHVEDDEEHHVNDKKHDDKKNDDKKHDNGGHKGKK